MSNGNYYLNMNQPIIKMKKQKHVFYFLAGIFTGVALVVMTVMCFYLLAAPNVFQYIMVGVIGLAVLVGVFAELKRFLKKIFNFINQLHE